MTETILEYLKAGYILEIEYDSDWFYCGLRNPETLKSMRF
jgi:hypothetical protein